jgi:threonine efflux protein
MFYTLLTIFLLHWAALVIPGANVLVVSSLAANGSRTAACFAALGVTVVAVIWSVFAVLGVNAVFAAHPFLRLSLQLAGGVYLIYVAVRLWRSGGNTTQAADFQMSQFAAFRLGFLTNITNPKSALFFGSIFATALPAEPSTTLLVAAVALIVADAFCWHMFLAFAFSHRPVQDFYVQQRTLISRFSSALVGAIGLRLLVAAATEVRLE